MGITSGALGLVDSEMASALRHSVASQAPGALEARDARARNAQARDAQALPVACAARPGSTAGVLLVASSVRARIVQSFILAGALMVPRSVRAADTASPIEVTVVGRSDETRPGRRDPSVASAVVPQARLGSPGLQGADVLRSQAGVTVTELGGSGAPAFASVRGTSGADTAIYLGGVRLNDELSGNVDLGTIPLFIIQRIEIYRGNAPLSADRQSPGGAIFFEPKQPRNATMGVGYQGGSYGLSRSHAYAGNRWGSTRLLLGLAAERAGNRYPFTDDRGVRLVETESTTEHRRNGDHRRVDGWFIGGTKLGSSATLDWVANLSHVERGVPRLALLQSRQARQSESRRLLGVRARAPYRRASASYFELGASALELGVTCDDPLRELSISTPHLSVVERRFEQHLTSRVVLTENLELEPILNLSEARISRTPNNIPLGSARRNMLRLGNGARWTLGRHGVVRGLVTGECHDTLDGEPFCDTMAPQGRVGVELPLGQSTTYLSAGRYVRVPSLGELYGVSNAVHGSPKLTPEVGNTVDLGLRWAVFPGVVLRKLSIDVFVYRRWSDNLIAYARSGQGFVYPYNVNRSVVRGVELLIHSTVGAWATAELNATLLDPRDTSPGRTTANDVLPYRSRLIVSPRLRLDFRRARRHGISGAGGQLQSVYQSNRYADPAGLATINAEHTVDTEAYLSWFNGLLTVRGRIANLFDAPRTDVVGYPLPGRCLYLGIEANQ